MWMHERGSSIIGSSISTRPFRDGRVELFLLDFVTALTFFDYDLKNAN
jgi:hypothetical protein